jgi:hypothetical protein
MIRLLMAGFILLRIIHVKRKRGRIDSLFSQVQSAIYFVRAVRAGAGSGVPGVHSPSAWAANSSSFRLITCEAESDPIETP